jgi:hypothetical protein
MESLPVALRGSSAMQAANAVVVIRGLIPTTTSDSMGALGTYRWG